MNQAHPASEFFPMMAGEEFDLLCDSMRKHGFDEKHPVLRYRGQTVDGRNRERAAAKTGVAVQYKDLPDDCDPFAEAFRANLARRNLRPAQRAAICLKVLEASEDWKRELKAKRERANKQRSEAQRGDMPARAASFDARPEAPDPHEKTAVSIARMAGVSPPTVERVQRLRREDPEAFEAEARGERKPERRKPPPRVDHEQRRKDVMRLHEEGLRTVDIAKKLGIDKGTISAVKTAMGISANSASPKLWAEVRLVTSTLCGARVQLDMLSERLRENQLVAEVGEVETCIKTLTNVLSSLRRFRSEMQKQQR